MNPGSKKHRSHKFTVVETKIAVPRHSRIDESLSRPKADQLGRHSHRGRRREPTKALETHLLQPQLTGKGYVEMVFTPFTFQGLQIQDL